MYEVKKINFLTGNNKRGNELPVINDNKKNRRSEHRK
jgi:hypothetical protein